MECKFPTNCCNSARMIVVDRGVPYVRALLVNSDFLEKFRDPVRALG